MPLEMLARPGQVGELLLSRTVQLPPVHASDAELGPDLLSAHHPIVASESDPILAFSPGT